MKNLAVILISLFSLAAQALGQDNNTLYFTRQLSEYFSDYYRLANANKIYPAQGKVIREIRHLLTRHGFTEEQLRENKIEELEDKINKILKISNKKAVLFVIPGSDIINCWLGELIEEKTEEKNIWGQVIKLSLSTIDNLDIKDFNYFLSKGKEALDVGTRGGTIYYNLEAYKMRANSIWDFFQERAKENKAKRYDPLHSNKLRKRLYYKIWLNLYLECVKNNYSPEEAKSTFINKATVLLKENSLLHEAGHIFANKYLQLENEAEEEAIAFLTELRYGTLPYDSLDMIIAAGYQSPLNSYNLAGRKIISYFVSIVQKGQKNKLSEYKRIDIKGLNQTKKMSGFFELTEDQIRLISEFIYKQKYEKRG